MIVNFKNFYLIEGGNLQLPDAHGQLVGADPMHMDPAHPQAVSRKERQGDLHDALSQMSDEHAQKTGNHIFGPNHEALNDGSAFMGSSNAFMDPKISHKEFAQFKPKVGDVDIAIPEEHTGTLADQLKPGKRYGKYTFVGGKKSGTQNLGLFRHDDGRVQQIDMEPATYENGRPSEWNQFAHGSDWGDVKSGVKGAFHKLLLRSVTAAQGTNGVVRNKKGDIRKFIPNYSFSVDRGMRPSHAQIGQENGDTIYREMTPKESQYDTSLPSIYGKMFGKAPEPSDMKTFGSYHGVLDSMKKHLNPEQQSRVADRYVRTIYEPGSQLIDNDHAEDQKMKDRTLDYMRNKFPDHFTPAKEAEIENMKQEYYKAKREKEQQKTAIKEETGYVPNEGNAASMADLSARGAPTESGPKKKKKSIKENATAAVGGLGFNTGNPAASDSYIANYVDGNTADADTRDNVLKGMIKNNHGKYHAPLGFKAFNPIQFKKAK